MKILNIIALGLLLMAASAKAEFGEKTNCRTEVTGKMAIYQGNASCYVNGILLQRYVFPTTQPSILLVEWTGAGYSQCYATVPFSHYENVTSTVCDYKPVADFLKIQHSFSLVSTAKDFDGTIVKHDWWINGVKQAGTGVSIPFPIPSTSVPQNLVVKLQVTDNDGYIHSVQKTVTVTNDDCSTPACRNR
jgi:hypothetical protein